jgi:DNA anti-recombination protein RmuC
MAQVEYQGFKLSGGKLMIILPLLGTLGTGIYAGFEFWKDYTNMKQQIQEYVAPDLSGLDKKLDVLKQKMAGVEDSVVKGTDYTRDIKNDLKKDITRLENVVDSTERRVKKSEQSMRDSTERSESRVRGYITKADDKARDSITKAEDRFDKRREQLRKNMTDLENRVNSELSALKKELDKKIKKALENPLAKLK